VRLLNLFHCLMGNHHRSRRKARDNPAAFTTRSVCETCGRKMIRFQGAWRLETKADREI